MRVLVACEYSATVRDAFRSRGHDAWSCDLLPTTGDPRWHVQGDIRNEFDSFGNNMPDLEAFDLLIAHPPCDHLSSAGAQYWPAKQGDGRQQAAIDFFMMLYHAPIAKVAVENPVGYMSRAFRKPDQIIQPWQFGDAESKRTCLWLKALPVLRHTNVVELPEPNYCIRKTGPKAGKRYNYYFHQGRSAHDRAKTFQGIANAMAEQWGSLCD